MILKYISGLKHLFESQPQFFTSTDAKTKAVSAGVLGTRLFLVERAGTAKDDAEGSIEYVDALNVAATDGHIEVDDKTLQFKYPEGIPVLTPDEVAEVGAPQRDLRTLSETFAKLIPDSQLFHIPGTIKGLRVPGDDPWALLNIRKGKLHMRVASEIANLDNAQEVPVAECGTVEGDHMFPVPLALIKKPLELEDKVAYSFAQDDSGTYYFIARTEKAKCIYSCMSYSAGEAPEPSGGPEEAEEEPADVEEAPVEEEEVENTEAEEAPPEDGTEEAPEPEEHIEGPCEEAPDDSGDTDGADDDSGSAEDDGDSVSDGSDVQTAAEEGEPVKKDGPTDYPLMETLDDTWDSELKTLESFVHDWVKERQSERRNIAKQVRPMARKAEKEGDSDELKKKLAAVESDRDALRKKLTGIKQELAPYKGLLNINWKLLD